MATTSEQHLEKLLGSNFSNPVSLFKYGDRVGLCSVLFEDCSAFTRATACTLAGSPIVTGYIKGLSRFITPMTSPIAFRPEPLPARTCTHWKAFPLHAARQKLKVGVLRSNFRFQGLPVA